MLVDVGNGGFGVCVTVSLGTGVRVGVGGAVVSEGVRVCEGDNVFSWVAVEPPGPSVVGFSVCDARIAVRVEVAEMLVAGVVARLVPVGLGVRVLLGAGVDDNNCASMGSISSVGSLTVIPSQV